MAKAGLGKVIFLSNILPLQRPTTVNSNRRNRNNEKTSAYRHLKKYLHSFIWKSNKSKAKRWSKRRAAPGVPAALKIIARQSCLTAGWPPLPFHPHWPVTPYLVFDPTPCRHRSRLVWPPIGGGQWPPLRSAYSICRPETKTTTTTARRHCIWFWISTQQKRRGF